jgi:hypothetical protein
MRDLILVHIAAEAADGVQECSRCGAKLWSRATSQASALPMNTKTSMNGDVFIFHYGSLDPQRFALCAPPAVDTYDLL